MLNTINSLDQTMSSREIARIMRKPHNDLMKAIREMELAWEKTTGKNFPLANYQKVTGNGTIREFPEYQLNKTECLYIATKFNNEARARLVIRWAELEEKEKQNTLRVPAPKIFNQVKCIHYTGWLLQNGYSIMSGQVRARIKKYPEQFRKTDKGWYMSEAIAEYFLNFKNPQQRIAEMPSVNPQFVLMFSKEELQEMTRK